MAEQHVFQNPAVRCQFSLFSENKIGENPTGEKDVTSDRPITPIEGRIKRAPRTLSELATHVRRCVSTRDNLKHFSKKQQSELAGILLGEIYQIWSDIRQQIDDPFLSSKENAELQCKMAVHIVKVCNKLFQDYLEKAEVLNDRKVFNCMANMSRLKTQLSLDAHNSLNVLTIRRRIADEVKKARLKAHDTPVIPPFDPTLEAKKIVASLPSARKDVLLDIYALIPPAKPIIGKRDKCVSPSSSFSSIIDIASTSPKSSSKNSLHSPENPILKRFSSVPNLLPYEKLSEEFDLENPKFLRIVKDDSCIRSLCNSTEVSPVVTISHSNKNIQKCDDPIKERLALIQNDLEALLTNRENDASLQDAATATSSNLPHFNKDIGEEMEPLLQAASLQDGESRTKQRDLLQKKILEENIREEQERVKTDNAPEDDKRMFVVKAENENSILASDTRVSDRLCLNDVTLSSFPPLYNDLLSEISSDTLLEMDSQLFCDQEIRDIYKEIGYSVSEDHFVLDGDPIIEKCAFSVNLSPTLASSTLNLKKREKIINPSLIRKKFPPWGKRPRSEWAKSPEQNAGQKSNLLSLPTNPALIPNIDQIREQSKKKKAGPVKGKRTDVMQKAYETWYAWWKEEESIEDFMKFCSLQETDYLSHVFHFYESDKEESDEEEDSETKRIHLEKIKRERERNEAVRDLRKSKAAFVPGEWNARCIFHGGLGQSPEPPEPIVTGPKPLITSRDFRLLSSMVSQNLSSSNDSLRPTAPSDSVTRSYVSNKKSTSGQETKHSDIPSDITESNILEKMQSRLDSIWTKLEMPDRQRLEMVVKYSFGDRFSDLKNVVDVWEMATEGILKREELIMRLEKFEEKASDPVRYFCKGDYGSSTTRLREAKERDLLYQDIEKAEKSLMEYLDDLEKQYSDTVTFKGRPYRDKLKWDRIEMLHWLQEKRKVCCVRKDIANQASYKHLESVNTVMKEFAPSTIDLPHSSLKRCPSSKQ